jgi:intracellular septation protein
LTEHQGGAKPAPPGWLQPAVDYGPLGVFFVAYCLFDVLVATAAMLAATVAVLGLSLALTRRVPMTTLITSAMIVVFGGLTLWLSDERYLKLQSTLISTLFSVILFAGMIFRWPLLPSVFGRAWPMTEAGWRALTLRFAVFFAGMAALNEAIARTQSTEIWVDWNVFGQTILTLAFLAAQWPLLNRHLEPSPADARREPKARP